MKNLLIITLFFPLITYSQSIVGIKAGVSRSFTYGYSGTKFLTTPMVGLNYTKPIRNFQFTVEPTYNPKGAISSYRKGSEDYRYKFNYLECPFTFGYYPINRKIILGAYFGLAPAYLLNSFYISPDEKRKLDGMAKFNFDYLLGIKSGINIGNKIYLGLNFRIGYSTFKQIPYSFHYAYHTLFLDLGYRLNKKNKK